MLKVVSKRYLPIAIIMSLFVSLWGQAFAYAVDRMDGSKRSDIIGHWAENTIIRWVNNGLLTGDGAGQYRPNDAISRAEFAALIHRLFNLPQQANEKPFTDVKSNAWYAGAIASVYAAGMIQGTGEGKFDPTAAITRQDAAVIVARAFQLQDASSKKAAFSDASQISAYASAAVASLQSRSYIQGKSDNRFAPKERITRAEVVQMIDNVMGALVKSKGTYEQDYSGNVVVNTAGVELKNLTIAGDLYITQGVGEGDILLDGVKVKGKTYVFGGGSNSVKIKDSRLMGMLVVDKRYAQVRILVSGATSVANVLMLSGGILEEGELTGAGNGFTDVEVNIGASAHSREVVLLGQFGKVHHVGVSVNFVLKQGTVVEEFTFDAIATVTGDGTIRIANIYVSGSNLSRWPDKVNFGKGVSATIQSKVVESDNRTNGQPVTNPPEGGNQPVTNPPGGGNEEPEDLSIVSNGQPEATVMIAASADEQTKQAAAKLIAYVKKATGAELPLVVDDSASSRATAENGIVHFEFNENPGTIPEVTDFGIQPIVNGAAAKRVQPNSITWDSETHTATLSVQAIDPASKVQSVAYRIFYKNEDYIESPTVVIGADIQAPINLNPSFEIGYNGFEDANPWRYWMESSNFWRFKRSNEQARNGQYSLKVTGNGVGESWPNQEVAITQYGDYEYSAFIYQPQETISQGTAQLFINLLDESGNHLASIISSNPVSTALSSSNWLKLNWQGQIAEQVNGVPVKHAMIGIELVGFNRGDVLYIDDAELIYHVNAGLEQKIEAPIEPAMQLANTVGDDPLAPEGQTLIYVGKKGLTLTESELLEGMADDGFVIHQNGKRITIAGPTSWGTEFGVSEFLERYVGVRWLMPGEDWEDIPVTDQLTIPGNDQVRQEPAFFSRTFESTSYPMREQWKRNNRMHWHVDFGHNLFNLLPPSIYKDTNPEFYPADADLSTIHTWQPCFRAEGIVDESIANINAFFDDHPEAESYSIGINDTTNFCEANPNHPDYPNKINSIGMVDISDIFFEWVNKVSAGVFAKHPDKYLGTYAYYNVYDPPSNIQLDPRVIVYITDDRLSWTDEDLRNAGHSLTEAWARTGATVAFYEYLYGAPYMVPRTYFDLMKDSYTYAADQGVQAFYSELYPNFGEGPKPWLSTKLQWNPYQDVDALLDEWYLRAVGPEAASDLKAYYEIWQKFWEEDIVETDWYKAWKNNFPRPNFMPLFTATYLKDVSQADLTESRRLLESAVAKAQTAKQKKRAQDLLNMFKYYEISAFNYPDLTEHIDDPTNEQEAMDLLNKAIQNLEQENERLSLVDANSDNELYLILGNITWDVVSNNHLWAIVNWISANPTGATKGRIDDLEASAEAENIRQFMGKLLTASYGIGVRNPGFEDGFAYWHDWSDTVAELTDDAHSGNKALRVNTSSREQTVYVEGGKTYTLTFYGKRSGSAEVGNLVGMNFWDVPGVGLSGARVTVSSAEYSKYQITFTAPMGFSHATIVVYRDPGVGWVYVDDFSLVEGNAPVEASLTGVTAANGVVQAVLSNAPAYPPTAGDFRVQPIVNGEAAANEQPVTVSWDTASKTATLTVPAVSPATTAQNVSYKVTYQGGEAVHSEEISIAADSGAPLNLNSSFEIGYEEYSDTKPWRYWFEAQDEHTKIFRTNEEARTGAYSIKSFGNGSSSWPNQEFALTQYGDYEFTAYFKTPTGLATEGKVKLFANVENAAGITLQAYASPAVAAASSNGEWTQIKWILTIPEQLNGEAVGRVFMGLELRDFYGTETVYIDDVEFSFVGASLTSLTGVTAANGVVQAVLSNAPAYPPTAGDFRVQPIVNGEAAANEQPVTVSWDTASKTATLTVPAVSPATTAQNVSYKVTYQGGEAVHSEEISIAADSGAPLNLNSSFEIGYEEYSDTKPWRYWFEAQDEHTKIFRTNEEARTGAYSIKSFGNGSSSWPNQEFALTQYGDYEFTAYFKTPTGLATEGKVKLFANVENAAGITLQAYASPAVAAASSNGEWTQIKWILTIPEQLNGEAVGRVFMGLELRDFYGTETVYIDDVELSFVGASLT